MTIPSVMQGMIETEDGKVFELDSPKGAAWLESIGSFRFESVGNNKPYTVRKETGKGGDYWYGYRKQNGKLHKKYIGKSSELSTVKLEEVAESLNTPPQPRVTGKVTEVAERSEQVVTGKVTADRLTALEWQVQALQESLEALRGELPGKSAEGDFSELPNSSNRVTYNELQIELGNLKAENEALKVNYADLLESSSVVADNLRKRVRESEARLEVERADREEVERQLSDRETEIAELRSQLSDRETEIAELRSQLSDRETESAPASDLFDKVSKLTILFRTLLPPKNTKLPKGTILEIEKILKGT